MSSGIDDRYDHPGKRYIPVTAYFHPDGRLEPVSFDWINGDQSVTTFQIDKVLEMRRAASMRAGGTGMRYTIMVRGKQRHLYLEADRWFVEINKAR